MTNKLIGSEKYILLYNDEVVIRNLIYVVQVILVSDLARFYEWFESKDINKAVKRNKERFMFQLEDEEYENLRFQSGTSKVRSGR